jgi:hypothetical protein
MKNLGSIRKLSHGARRVDDEKEGGQVHLGGKPTAATSPRACDPEKQNEGCEILRFSWFLFGATPSREESASALCNYAGTRNSPRGRFRPLPSSLSGRQLRQAQSRKANCLDGRAC